MEMADDVSDDICDCWEDMIENGVLEKKLEEFQAKASFAESRDAVKLEDVALSPQLVLEDTTRTQYTPQVKILKRPAEAKISSSTSGGDRSPCKQPVKTLQQREAEYAVARLRILGASSSDEEAQREKLARMTLIGTDGKGGGCSEGSPEASSSVVRQPRGPDGTKGFLVRR